MTVCDICEEIFNGLGPRCHDCREKLDMEDKEDQDCPRCRGTGEIDSMDYTDGSEECYRCHGKGFI